MIKNCLDIQMKMNISIFINIKGSKLKNKIL